MTTLTLLLTLTAIAPAASETPSTNQAPAGVLLDFTATWCGPCQQMSPIVSKLQREGYPVRKVDIDQEKALANRFNISSIPAFVLVVNGKEVMRKVGATSEGELRQMLARIPSREPQNIAAADGAPTMPVSNTARSAEPESKGIRLPFFSKSKPNAPDDSAEVAAAFDESAQIRSQAPGDVTTPATPLGASTRIRVREAQGKSEGVNFGSGTIIDSKPGRTVILTCGHIFRDMKEGAVIEVDVFDSKSFQTYLGKVITYNLDSDVGLIAIPTATALGCSRIAAPGIAISEGEHVFSIGCGGGQPPSRLQARVTKLNRYRGPDNIECTGAPIPGRSGGGLFNSRGEVVGVCFAADTENKCGLYTGLNPIYTLLDKASLTHVYRPAATPGSAPGTIGLADAGSPNAAFQADSVASAPATLRETADGDRARPPVGRLDTQAAPGVREEESEVICIVRPLNDPQAASRIIVINRASSKFMSYLKGELKSQPRPTSMPVELPPELASIQAATGFRGTPDAVTHAPAAASAATSDPLPAVTLPEFCPERPQPLRLQTPQATEQPKRARLQGSPARFDIAPQRYVRSAASKSSATR